ncbi:MAG: AgmX/PglI C-terminal domain-containing protein [Nannocystaceae bacterium]
MPRRRRALALLPALVVLACARKPAEPPASAPSYECIEAMPPVHDIDTYAGAAPPIASPWLAHTLDREPLREVVRAHQHELRACYEAGLRHHPDLRGVVEVRWTILPDTSVTDVVLSGTSLRDACVVTCVLREVATWTFPRYGGREFRISYPFRFDHG